MAHLQPFQSTGFGHVVLIAGEANGGRGVGPQGGEGHTAMGSGTEPGRTEGVQVFHGWCSFCFVGAATNRRQTIMGGSRAQVGEPGQKEPGRPEGLPRTATIKRHCGHKKSACNGMVGACAPLSDRAAKPGH